MVVLVAASALIGAVTFVVLPLTFLSTALMRGDLLPDWMQTARNLNPVDWAIEAGRNATAGSADWGWWRAMSGSWPLCWPCVRCWRRGRSGRTSAASRPANVNCGIEGRDQGGG